LAILRLDYQRAPAQDQWFPRAFAAGISADCGETDMEFFENQIRPLLVKRCCGCHSVDQKIKGGLQLELASAWPAVR